MGVNTFVCLTSNASRDAYAGNHNTAFTNKLPTPIQNPNREKLFIKVHSIYICNKLKREATSGGFLQIEIREVEDQRQGKEYQKVCATLPFPLPQRNLITPNYGYFTFKHAPVLPTQFEFLNELHVRITDNEGELVESPLDIPTIVLVEITDRIMDEQFTINSVSLHPDLFPGNTLAKFTAPLAQEIFLPSHQVALLQVIYPPYLKDAEETAMLTLNGMEFTWRLSDFKSTVAFLSTVRKTIRGNGWTNEDFDFGVPEEGELKGQIVLKRKENENIDELFLEVTMSESFCQACGMTGTPQTKTNLMENECVNFGPISAANLYNALPEPMTTLTCDIIEANVLGGQQAHVLQCLPVLKEKHELQPRLYEPEQLAYHDVVARPFNAIKFEFRNPDGSVKNFVTPHTTDKILINLIFRKRKEEGGSLSELLSGGAATAE